MSFTNIWIHAVWATKARAPFLHDRIRQKIFSHIRQHARENDIHIDFINGYIDHVHILLCMKADQCISTLIKLIKGESSYWVNKRKMIPTIFDWQDDYFAVSVGESDLYKVRNYIRNQEEHHRKKTFKEEYEELLKKSGILLNVRKDADN